MSGDRLESAPILDVWIERTLDLSPEMDSNERQREILRRLEDVQFHPGFYEASALQGYFEQQLSPIAKWHACERLLRDDYEHFRREFFDLSIEERKTRYEKLRKDAEHFPVLKHLLGKLEVGLSLSEDSLQGLSPEAQSLARFLLGQVAEEPHRIAAMRREYEQTHAYARDLWKSTVRELREKTPDLLAIDRRWLRVLENPPKAMKKLAKIGSSGDDNGSTKKSGCAIAIVIFFVLRFLSVIERYGDSETDTYKYTRSPALEEPVQFDSDKMREILQSLEVPKTKPLPFDVQDQSQQTDQRRLQQLDALAELKEYQFERFDDAPFKIVKETGLLYIVFDQELYLSEMSILSLLPNPEETRLYRERKEAFEQFQIAKDLILLLQSEVYVTYIGMDPTTRRPPPKGTVLRPMLSESPIANRPLSDVTFPEDHWRERYRIGVPGEQEVNGE